MADDSGEKGRPPTEEERTVSWRESRLELAGFNSWQAAVLAEAPGVDLHRAIDLLKRGCDPETAVDILL